MAFWKMAGLEVIPTIPSSIIRSSPPFFMSSRESSSTQGACPSSCIFRKRSFTSSSLWARSYVPSVYTRAGTASAGRAIGCEVTLPPGDVYQTQATAPIRAQKKSRASTKARLRKAKKYPLEGDIFKVFFIYVYLVAVAALAPPSAPSAPSTGGRAAVVGVAGAPEELDIVCDDVHLAPLGAVLRLPGAVLEAALDEDGIALFLVVGDGLPEFAPGADVEEVNFLVPGAHPVDREPEGADRYPVIGEPELGISRKISGEYDAVETDHFRPPLYGPLGLTLQEHPRYSSA